MRGGACRTGGAAIARGGGGAGRAATAGGATGCERAAGAGGGRIGCSGADAIGPRCGGRWGATSGPVLCCCAAVLSRRCGGVSAVLGGGVIGAVCAVPPRCSLRRGCCGGDCAERWLAAPCTARCSTVNPRAARGGVPPSLPCSPRASACGGCAERVGLMIVLDLWTMSRVAARPLGLLPDGRRKSCALTCTAPGTPAVPARTRGLT